MGELSGYLEKTLKYQEMLFIWNAYIDQFSNIKLSLLFHFKSLYNFLFYVLFLFTHDFCSLSFLMAGLFLGKGKFMIKFVQGVNCLTEVFKWSFSALL